MFLLHAQNNLYIILSSLSTRLCKKNSTLNFMSSVGFRASKIWMFFGKFAVELVWKSISGKNNSLEPPAFLFFNSRLYDLEESIKRVESFD